MLILLESMQILLILYARNRINCTDKNKKTPASAGAGIRVFDQANIHSTILLIYSRQKTISWTPLLS